MGEVKKLKEQSLPVPLSNIYHAAVGSALTLPMGVQGIRSHSQIVPLIVGDSKKAVDLSVRLKNLGYQALPIRTPTVPKGTERIRFSLNADITMETAKKLLTDLKTIL